MTTPQSTPSGPYKLWTDVPREQWAAPFGPTMYLFENGVNTNLRADKGVVDRLNAQHAEIQKQAQQIKLLIENAEADTNEADHLHDEIERLKSELSMANLRLNDARHERDSMLAAIPAKKFDLDTSRGADHAND